MPQNQQPLKPMVAVAGKAPLPVTVTAAATGVPAFIGYTQKALDASGKNLTNLGVQISALTQYEQYFGVSQLETGINITCTQVQGGGNTYSFTFAGSASKHNLYNAVRLFYDNGGGPCYIVSVGPYKAIGSALLLTDLIAGLQALQTVTAPDLIVISEAQQLTENDFYALQAKALDHCGQLGNRFYIMDMYNTGVALKTPDDLNHAVKSFRNGFTSANYSYGAAYFPNVVTTYGYHCDETVITVNQVVNGVPGGPLNGKTLSSIKSANIAAYNAIINALSIQMPYMLPASPAVAGVYAQVDRSGGVWKAPANIALNSVLSTTFQITDTLQSGLSEDTASGKSINAIRRFPGKGILVWGARTLDGNNNDYKYVPVRRLFIMVEQSIKVAAWQFVFEPNESGTWGKLSLLINNFLNTLWRAGAMAGPKPEQAYYVRIGLGQSMTANDILNGKLIIELGIAPLRPAEFIVLRISQTQQKP